MDSIGSTRPIAMLLFLGGGMAFAQSTLPATHPTVPPPAGLTSPSSAAPSVPTRPVYDAMISYAQGQLKVSADNSSLSQILREISRVTGMTITGGVADQRVFGNYGPAPLPEILINLLQGTGTNIMLLNNASNAPTKLILTQQQGGPTPPNPNAAGFDDNPNPLIPVMSMPADRSRLNVPPPFQRPPRPVYAPPISIPESTPAPASIDTNSDPVPDSAPTDNPASPNGVQTPQQIYQQLLRLQNAQPKQ